jgi:Adenylate and Guanylate cyclase catalytic domain
LLASHDAIFGAPRVVHDVSENLMCEKTLALAALDGAKQRLACEIDSNFVLQTKPIAADPWPAIPTSAAPPATPIYQDTAERRQVTVMFSDLVDSTALSARMDPEDLREVIAAYQKCVAETVGRSGGFVAKYIFGSRPLRQLSAFQKMASAAGRKRRK